MKWEIHLDRDDHHLYDDERYSITLNKDYPGWRTDGGYQGYGLPKKLAQWICDRLNETDKECPFKMSTYGNWNEK